MVKRIKCDDIAQYLLPFAVMHHLLLMMLESFTRDDVQTALGSPMRNSTEMTNAVATSQRNGMCKSSSIKNIERDDSTAR